MKYWLVNGGRSPERHVRLVTLCLASVISAMDTLLICFLKLKEWRMICKMKWFVEECRVFTRTLGYKSIYVIRQSEITHFIFVFPETFLLRNWAAHQQGTPKTSFSPVLLSTAVETVYWIKISQRLLLCHFASSNSTHLFWPSEALKQFLTVVWVSPNITDNKLLVGMFLFFTSE